MDLQKEYERVYNNYQLCLATFEAIVLLAKDRNDKQLADMILETIKKLDTEFKINY